MDKKFEQNYINAKNCGLKVGVYVYSYVETSKAMQSAINWVQSKLSGKTLEYPVFLDVEDEQISKLNKETLTSLCEQFCKRLEGFQTGVYANKNWFTNKLNINELVNYKIWVAEWNGKENHTANFKVDMWQYTSDGSVDGISTRVDMNYCLNCDNQNVEDITGEQEGSEFEMPKTWKNGSTNETVYADVNCTKEIGLIYPRGEAECYGIKDGKYLVCYNIYNGNNIQNRKVGFVKYNGGVK